MINRPETDARFAEVEASIVVTLRFPSGGLAQFVASFGAAEFDSYRVIESSGDPELDPGFKFDFATRLHLRRGGRVEETTFPRIDQFGAQVAYFSDCIRCRTRPEADGEEGLADLRALVAVEAAARTGLPQPIASPPAPGTRAPIWFGSCPSPTIAC